MQNKIIDSLVRDGAFEGRTPQKRSLRAESSFTSSKGEPPKPPRRVSKTLNANIVTRGGWLGNPFVDFFQAVTLHNLLFRHCFTLADYG